MPPKGVVAKNPVYIVAKFDGIDSVYAVFDFVQARMKEMTTAMIQGLKIYAMELTEGRIIPDYHDPIEHYPEDEPASQEAAKKTAAKGKKVKQEVNEANEDEESDNPE